MRLMTTEPKMYKSKEIAEALGVTQPTIRKWVSDGRLVGNLVGDRRKALMISESDLKKFLDENPRYKAIWDYPIIREVPHDIKVYIRDWLKILDELYIVLTTDQTLHLWSLRSEFAIDSFLHDVITGKAKT